MWWILAMACAATASFVILERRQVALGGLMCVSVPCVRGAQVGT